MNYDIRRFYQLFIWRPRYRIYVKHYNEDSIRFDSVYILQCQCYSMLGDKTNLRSSLEKLIRLAQKYYNDNHAIYATNNKYTEILKTM
jgi:hypothetical protein